MPSPRAIEGALATVQRLLRGMVGGRAAHPAAARLDRLVEEAPASFMAYDPEELARVLFYARGENELTSMNPRTFLDLAYPLTETDRSMKNIENLKALLEHKPTYPYPEAALFPSLPMNRAGFSDLPFLTVSMEDSLGIPRVRQHEGRHRMRALEELFGPAEPFAVQVKPYSDPEEIFNAAEWASQKYPERTRWTPPRYKRGGSSG